MNYTQLDEAVCGLMLKFFAATCSPPEIEPLARVLPVLALRSNSRVGSVLFECLFGILNNAGDGSIFIRKQAAHLMRLI
jgi:hypothetical protein